ncbi:L,D-transpeptidase [uncultured Demequina sp.]|uniref:L,D-transpeptidase n=1 Tax=uncultured Demequina sp. TaxID=693499 RepID=UPI0025E8AB26|nr:L,D-transpeptidase [uncultured Demequina sp.]
MPSDVNSAAAADEPADSVPADKPAATEPTATEPTATEPKQRNRALVAAIVAAAVAAAVAVVAIVFWPRPDDDVQASGTPSTSPATPAPSTTPSPSPSATSSEAGIAPGEMVVQTTGAPIAIFANAGDQEPSGELSEWSLYGSPTTLLGFDSVEIDGAMWIEVEGIGAPNHERSWVRADDVTVTSTDMAIHIYLDERELELVDGAEVVLTSAVVIGADESPTPLGTFWVTDPLDFSTNDTGVYGAYALGLNGFSEVLEEFNGGPPQIAVHGTNQPDLVGQAVSNGCIRVPNAVALDLGAAAPVGTPVIVSQSRSA